MRVLLCAGDLSPAGTGPFSLDLARGLGASGDQVQVIGQGGLLAELFSAAGVLWRELPGVTRGMFSPLAFYRAYRVLKDFQPEVIHAVGVEAVRLAAHLSWWSRCPVVLTVVTEKARHVALPVQCRGVFAASEDIRESLVNKYRVPKELVHLVPLGVDTERFRPVFNLDRMPTRGTSLRESDIQPSPLAPLPPPNQVPIVVAAGPFVPRGGFTTFLEAAGKLRASGLDAEFFLFGEGPQEALLRRQARELDIYPRTTFVQSACSWPQLLAEADVFVFPGHEESGSLNLLQAMAAACAVIATPVGGVQFGIQDGTHGFLVPPGKTDLLVAALRKLLNNHQARFQAGLAARQLVRLRFPLGDVVGLVREGYQRALSAFQRQKRRAKKEKKATGPGSA